MEESRAGGGAYQRAGYDRGEGEKTGEVGSKRVLSGSTYAPSRRTLFRAIGVGVGVAALQQVSGKARAESSGKLKPLGASSVDSPPLPDGLHPAHFVMHSRVPLTLESKRHLIGTSVITDRAHLFVRNNLPMPSAEILADRDAWEIEVTGVREPQRLSLRVLKRMGLSTVAAVLQMFR